MKTFLGSEGYLEHRENREERRGEMERGEGFEGGGEEGGVLGGEPPSRRQAHQLLVRQSLGRREGLTLIGARGRGRLGGERWTGETEVQDQEGEKGNVK